MKSHAVQPGSFDAEKRLICGGLIDNNVINEARHVQPEFFSCVSHQNIWRAMRALFVRHEDAQVTGASVAQELRERGEFEQCGGNQYLMTILDCDVGLADWDLDADMDAVYLAHCDRVALAIFGEELLTQNYEMN